MTEAMKKRLLAVGALVVAAGALGWVSMSDLGDNLVYYWSPSELMENQAKAEGAIVRLGGMVVEGTFEWDAQAQTATFDITDGGQTIHVNSKGNPPQMFREGIGVVVEGELDGNQVFQTEKIMVKHSNEYEAPEGEMRVEDMYKTLKNSEES
jgi:cytochrome c-type biogenesis protein CcmE